MHLSARGKTSTPHELQKCSPWGGLTPQPSQIIALGNNFLPQFLQYILTSLFFIPRYY
jgi:hypothetical protein